jgi:hypothetical protein
MAIQIVRQKLEHEPMVLAFNQRMAEGGSGWGFYSRPDERWLPQHPEARTWREYYLAIEDGQFVRGAYALKPQYWSVRGHETLVCDWQGPFSEGAINARYATLGVRFIRDMLKRYPLLFSVGHGGFDEPMVRLLRTLGWTMLSMPFCLRICNPRQFLLRNGYLRRTARNRLFLDLLANSGLGHLGVRTVQAAIGLANGGRRGRADVEQVPAFAEWTDWLWDRHHKDYTCLAQRDSRMMNTLIPPSGFQKARPLRVSRDGKTIGWAVVHHTPRTHDTRFGDLSVGLVSDCFAAPQDAFDTIYAANKFLESQGTDVIYSNQSHPAWVQAFRASGYIILPNRRLFAFSPKMAELLAPLDTLQSGLHLTNMDGHGPHGFE